VCARAVLSLTTSAIWVCAFALVSCGQAFDTPDNLLKNKDGYFVSRVDGQRVLLVGLAACLLTTGCVHAAQYKQLTEENSGIE
jgi:hypothetical protein